VYLAALYHSRLHFAKQA